MKLIKNKQSQFGNFDFQAKDGWRIIDSFIDYESKLLIVETYPIDKSYNGSIEIYVIDTYIPKILSREEWKKRFNYKKVIEISKDGKLKSIFQRVPAVVDDKINYRLIDLESGKEILHGSRNAFSESKWNLFEKYYDEQKRKSQAEIEERKFLTEEYSKYSTEQKGAYHIHRIYFQDRMRSSYYSGNDNPAVEYFSKDFYDYYKKYDNHIIQTLYLIGKEFDVNKIFINELIKYELESAKWKNLAYEYGLID